MRRILIDNRVKDIAFRFSKELFVKYHDRKFVHPLKRLRALHYWLSNQADANDYAVYVWNIILHYHELLRLEPQDFFTYYITYFGDVEQTDMNHTFNIQPYSEVEKRDREVLLPEGRRQFNELVQWAMRYKDLRSNDYIHFFKELNIRSCVYCNAQYAIVLEDVVENNQKKNIARFQLDHFWPESLYPFLCTTFFNLQPSCANCNLHKSDNKGLFNLYTNKVEDVNPFWFELGDGTCIDGLTGYQLRNMHIRLCSKDAILLRNHQERFLIDKIYEHHKREAQETIIRLATNDYYYRKQLGKSLSALFPEGVESPERFYWGHEMDEKNVHERPLNKLVQDIVNNYQ